MSEVPKKEKKKAIDYVGIAALVTAIPTAFATMYGIMSYQQANAETKQESAETKQYGTVLAQGVFNARASKIDALKDKDTDILLALKGLEGGLALIKATCNCGDKRAKRRPRPAKKAAAKRASPQPVVEEIVSEASPEMSLATLEGEDEIVEDMVMGDMMREMEPSFEQVQEQAEEGQAWDLFGGSEE